MDLWIRSQNKMMLRKIDNAFINDGTICTYSGDDAFILGEYANKERVLEVLDEIQKLLTPKIFALTNNIRENKKDTELTNCYALVGGKNGIDIKELSTVVYEMPKD